jgi:hypothetical protein
MSRRVLVFFLGLLVPLFGVAQHTFSKVEGELGTSEFATIVAKTSRGYLLHYGDKNQTEKTYCLGTMALDHSGNVLKKSRICYGVNKIVRYGRNLTLSNGNVTHYGTLQ